MPPGETGARPAGEGSGVHGTGDSGPIVVAALSVILVVHMAGVIAEPRHTVKPQVLCLPVKGGAPSPRLSW